MLPFIKRLKTYMIVSHLVNGYALFEKQNNSTWHIISAVGGCVFQDGQNKISHLT